MALPSKTATGGAATAINRETQEESAWTVTRLKVAQFTYRNTAAQLSKTA
jgi:hypothetical protein